MAADCSRRLLTVHRVVAADHPHLSGRRLYEEVVAQFHHCDARTAQAVIRDAEQSYASWPVDRDLSFRDVVHFVAVSEIFAAHSATPWAESDIKRTIEALIPQDV